MKKSFLTKSLIAHRGVFDNNKIPENSLPAFEKAIEKKYIIELDVHLTKDNQIVVFHDETLYRMTDTNGYIKDFTLEELKKQKLLKTKYKIPSLDEVLELIDGKVPVLIELKDDMNGLKLPKLLFEKLKTYKGKVAIQSFSPLFVAYFRFHKNDYLRGLLISKYKFLITPFSILICKPDFLSVNKRLYKKIKKYFKKRIVISWTMRNNEDINKYKDLYDNLICNIDDCF